MMALTLVNKDTLIGDALKLSPVVAPVIEEYLGSCSSCMGMEYETIEYGAQIHDVDPQFVVDKINEELSKLM